MLYFWSAAKKRSFFWGGFCSHLFSSFSPFPPFFFLLSPSFYLFFAFSSLSLSSLFFCFFLPFSKLLQILYPLLPASFSPFPPFFFLRLFIFFRFSLSSLSFAFPFLFSFFVFGLPPLTYERRRKNLPVNGEKRSRETVWTHSCPKKCPPTFLYCTRRKIGNCKRYKKTPSG